jgi:formylglycine-generating enzyme required for sulfatase activity
MVTPLRKILSFFARRWITSLLGILTVAFFIWFAGPLIAFAEYIPLASTFSRIISILVIFFLWLLTIIVRYYIAVHANKKFLREITARVSGEASTDWAQADEKVPNLHYQSDDAVSTPKGIGIIVWIRTHYQKHWYEILRWALPALGLAGGAGLALGALSSAPVAYALGAGLLGLAWVQGGRVALRTSSNLQTKLPAAPVIFEDPRLTLVALPAGVFWMGSNLQSDPQALDEETPRHGVRLSSFAMSQAPVTRGLYRAIMQSVPDEWQGDQDEESLPANYVLWTDAVRFCNALSEDAGFTPCYRRVLWRWRWNPNADGYRLPTEAEWEYACRAGTETPWFWGDNAADSDRFAWFSGNSGSEVQSVMSKAANPWGLHDMAGNVWEWCWDRYGAYSDRVQRDPRGPWWGWGRVLRGGSFGSVPGLLRSARRDGGRPGARVGGVGFRCVRGSGRH